MTYPKHLLLKFCYMGHFNNFESIEKFKNYEEWHNNSQMNILSDKARKILELGVFYQYGRDSYYIPVIYIRPHKINLSQVCYNLC